jgi:hypothetical protein
MNEISEQFSRIRVSRFKIVLQAGGEAVLPALMGSTLRGAFGHALKAISCSVSHQNCEKCFLSEVCLYPTIFEPTSASKNRDVPRPFVFQPPVPPLTREISAGKILKLRIAEGASLLQVQSSTLSILGCKAERFCQGFQK